MSPRAINKSGAFRFRATKVGPHGARADRKARAGGAELQGAAQLSPIARRNGGAHRDRDRPGDLRRWFWLIGQTLLFAVTLTSPFSSSRADALGLATRWRS